MLTKSEENYIKEIYALEQKHKADVNTNLLAEKIETKASSVTDMLKKLAKKELLIYQKYKGVKLNSKGEKIALSVIRKHRLWETFLVEKLDFSWDEVHKVAEQLEHIRSEKLTNKLDVYLNFPKVDPHGNPIPDVNGKLIIIDAVCLDQFEIEEEGIFIEVKDESENFLKYLTKNNIVIGAKIKVLEKEEFDNSFKIEIDRKQFNISENVIKNLYLKK
ncbi:metal-dependent transcriptional regulator [Ancylomarina sp. 16SWW S1-10-2]|uniref:metal-dependent transcriptional regulator n=1 Tax=Ancylomarina sp. 16SWW S1-10-2 TaxID=2499681 RepID=UPI0012AE1341|nr:iron dependent repressor, metal binding and dimerization domain protein [Ancylomarina sp. 16SWW S1-10-2]MRT94321.1 metal-dependent transcriptional regulator [Ancylomarina sp. 16SWW S1-10-2]